MSEELREQLHEIWIHHSGVKIDSQPVEETLDLIRKAKIEECEYLLDKLPLRWGDHLIQKPDHILAINRGIIFDRIAELTQEEK